MLSGMRPGAMKERLLRLLDRLAADRRGSVGFFLAVAIVPLLAAIGLSVDGARGWLVKARLSQAIDAAGLAGGRVMLADDRDADIRMFFDANFPPGFMGATDVNLTIAADEDAGTIILDATATVPTTFMRVVGINDMRVRANTVVQRTDRGMELVLVMDNTGSMAGSKITAMKNAATDLVNILYGDRETVANLWIGVVPYVANVNIGPSRIDWTVPRQFDPVDVSSVTVTANGGAADRRTTTVCVTTATPHGLKNGALVDISGATPSEYNGRFMIRLDSTSGCTITSPATKFWYIVPNPTRTNSPTVPKGTIRVRQPGEDYSAGGSWKGCVEARDPPYEEEQAEALPTVQPWYRFFWPSTRGVLFYDENKVLMTTGGSPRQGDNQWGPPSSPVVRETSEAGNDAYGPNLGCGPEITPLQPNKSTALAAISAMAPWSRGGTMANVGLAWGWRVLSPAWRGLWGDPQLPLDYDTPLIDKVVVLLTDGVNQWYDMPGRPPGCDGISGCTSPRDLPSDADFTAYRRLSDGRLGTTDEGTATNTINSRMSRLCEAMKAKGIIIYTIVLQENNPATQDLFRSCASKPEYFFVSPTAADLGAIFREIATQLSNLRLAR